MLNRKIISRLLDIVIFIIKDKYTLNFLRRITAASFDKTIHYK